MDAHAAENLQGTPGSPLPVEVLEGIAAVMSGVGFECRDCGVDTDAIREVYLVADSVWEHAWATPASKAGRETGRELGREATSDRGVLCVACLEQRLGRNLASRDFVTSPVNDSPSFSRSLRLTARLRDLRDASGAWPALGGAL